MCAIPSLGAEGLSSRKVKKNERGEEFAGYHKGGVATCLRSAKS